MTQGDIHNLERRLKTLKDQIKTSSDITPHNQDLLLEFSNWLTGVQNLSLNRSTRYLFSWKTIAEHVTWKIDEPLKEQVTELVADIHQGNIKDMASETQKEYKKAIRKMYHSPKKGKQGFLEYRNPDFDGEPFTDFFTLTVDRKYTDPGRLPHPKHVKSLVEHAVRIRDKAYMMTLWSTAGRHGEVLGLKWRDIRFKDELVKLAFRDTKTGGDHKVSVATAYPYLKELKEQDHQGSDPDAFVFRSLQSDEQLSGAGAANIIKRVREKTDGSIPGRIKVNPHAWRKGRASHLARLGWSESKICKFGNWVPGSPTVRYYVRLAQEDIEDAVREEAGLAKREKNHAEEKVLNPRICGECGTANKFEAENCMVCGEFLPESNFDEFTEIQIEEKTEQFMEEIIRSETGFDPVEINEKAKQFVEEEFDL